MKKDERVTEWGKKRIRERELPDLEERLMLYMVDRANSCPGSRTYCQVSGTIEDAVRDLGVDQGEVEESIRALHKRMFISDGLDVSPALPSMRWVFPHFTHFYTGCARWYLEENPENPEYGELLQYVRDTYSAEDLTNYMRGILEAAASPMTAAEIEERIKRELDALK